MHVRDAAIMKLETIFHHDWVQSKQMELANNGSGGSMNKLLIEIIDKYLKKTQIKRHEGAGRWYSQGESKNWKPSVTTVIGETCSKGKFFD